jgi:microcystin-dependent protein
MTDYSVQLGQGTLILSVNQGSQSIAGNYSDDSWSLTLNCSNRQSYNNYNNVRWDVNINGSGYGGNFGFDFRNSSSKLIATGTTRVAHNADGTKSISVSGSIGATATSAISSGGVSGTYYQSTIARASNSTFSASTFDAGDPMTISTNRASTSFTHTLSYTFGAASGTIGTDIGDSVVFTPTLSLLNEIPNSLSGVGEITTQTYSGATLIGTTSRSFTLTVPSEIIPTISSISHSENVAQVDSLVGAYVEGITRLNVGIVGGGGAYGSTISSRRITVDEHTINAVSGVTGVISNSGNRTITAVVTDSRGRVGSQALSVNVLAYVPPSINLNTLSMRRAFVNGTLNEDGTYIKISFSAAVQSLINSTEKNAIRYRISTRPRGDTVWTVVQNTTPGGITVNGTPLIGTYAIDASWDVLLEAIDIFATTASTSTVATSAIFMHWDGGAGLGVGKYREQGQLDVAGDVHSTGQMHQNGGRLVLDEDDLESIVSSQLAAGSIMEWPTATAPANWALCQGQTLSRTGFASLYAVIGTTYGVGDGSTTFNVPDFRGRAPVGLDASQTEFNTLGAAFGTQTHTLTTAEMPSHTHSINNYTWVNTGPYGVANGSAHSFNVSAFSPAAAGGGGAHNNVQPSRVINFIIKTSNGDTPGDSQLTGRVGTLEGFVGGQVLRRDSAQTFPPSAWYVMSDPARWTESARGSSVAAFNGGWVAPVSGLYSVDVQMQFVGTISVLLAVKKNSFTNDDGGSVLSHATTGIAGVTPASASGEVRLAAGDILRLAIFPTGYSGSVQWSTIAERSRFGFRLVQRM